MRLYFPAAAILLTSLLSAAPVINEVQSTNTSLPDQYGQLIDWVEIYNPTNVSIDLSGYRLSDSLNDRSKFVFPAVSIGPGRYLLVWCGQSAEFPVPGPYPAGQLRSASFAISSLPCPSGRRAALAVRWAGEPPIFPVLSIFTRRPLRARPTPRRGWRPRPCLCPWSPEVAASSVLTSRYSCPSQLD